MCRKRVRNFWGRWLFRYWAPWMAYANGPAEEYNQGYAGQSAERPQCGYFMRRGWGRRGSEGWGPWEDWGPWAGFAGGPRGRFFEFGEVRLAILSLLREDAKHGYQLIKELSDRSGGLYRASAGTVYPTLQQLEDEGLIESERQEGRRVYRLTAAGKEELEKDPEAVNRIWRRAERWEDWGQWMGPEAFAVFRPLAGMVKATFRAAKWAHGRPEREEKLAAIIERFRHELDEFRGESK
jgi:DNA-binding PadR family transcriptional regulator